MFTIYRFLEANMFHDNTCLCCLGVEVLIFLCSICLSYFAFPSIILLLPGTELLIISSGALFEVTSRL